MGDNKHLTPVAILYADGKRLDVEHEGALREIMIKDTLNGISSFSVMFDTTETKIADKGLLALESGISIHLGYKDDVEEVFTGEILEMEAILPEYGSEQLEVSGFNVLHKLTHGEHSVHYEKMKASEILKGIIESYSLKAEVEDFGAEAEFSSNDGYTNYEYLINSAARYGKEVFADKDTIYIANDIAVRSDEVILEWGKSLISFRGGLSMKQVLSGYDYAGWDPLKGESFTGGAALSDLAVKVGGSKDWTKASKGGGGKFTGYVTDLRIYDSADAKEQAKGQLQRNSFGFGYARGTCEGNYKIRPGMRVTVKMVGEKFEGEYIAEQVTHRFTYANGYTTSVILKRNMIQGTSNGPSEVQQQQAAEAGTTPAKEETGNEAEQKNPTLKNPQWLRDGSEITESLIDDEVALSVEVEDISNGETVKIEIWENDEDNEHDFVEKLQGKVQNGKVEIPWKVKYTADDDDSTSGKELAEKGYTLPEYHFAAHYNGAESVKSGVMEVKEWIKVFVTNEETGEIIANTNCIIQLSDNTEQEVTTDADGCIYLDYLPFGKMFVRIFDEYTE